MSVLLTHQINPNLMATFHQNQQVQRDIIPQVLNHSKLPHYLLNLSGLECKNIAVIFRVGLFRGPHGQFLPLSSACITLFKTMEMSPLGLKVLFRASCRVPSRKGLQELLQLLLGGRLARSLIQAELLLCLLLIQHKQSVLWH